MDLVRMFHFLSIIAHMNNHDEHEQNFNQQCLTQILSLLIANNCYDNTQDK